MSVFFPFLSFSSLPRFRQHFSLVVPKAGDLYATLDACKVVDNVVFLISPPTENESTVSNSTLNEGALGFDGSGEKLLSAIMAQGLPSPIFVINEFESIPIKKRSDYKKVLQKQLSQMIPLEKLQVIDNEMDALRLLHQIGSQKQRPIYQRNMRSHLLSEELNFKQNPDDPTVGTLFVDGYVRYQPLNVNGLVHIPGWGDFQMERIEIRKAPGEFDLLEDSNPTVQETLKSENDVDLMNGEQTWPYQEEMDGKTEEDMEEENGSIDTDADKKKRVPKGTSEYQAAWIKDDGEHDLEDDDDSDEWEDEEMSDEEEEDDEDDVDGSLPEEDDAEDMESVDNEDRDTHTYDKKVNFADEEEDFKRVKGKLLIVLYVYQEMLDLYWFYRGSRR